MSHRSFKMDQNGSAAKLAGSADHRYIAAVPEGIERSSLPVSSIAVSIDPAIRRRRVSFRAWHRGTREMDLILGRFVDSELADLSPTELDLFEALLERPDPDLYAWVTGEIQPPSVIDTPLFARIRAFHNRAGSLHG